MMKYLFTHEVLQLFQLGLFVGGDVEALGGRGRRQRELRRHRRVRPRVHPHRALPEIVDADSRNLARKLIFVVVTCREGFGRG